MPVPKLEVIPRENNIRRGGLMSTGKNITRGGLISTGKSMHMTDEIKYEFI